MEIKEISREIPINKFENQTQKKMLMNDFTPWCLARHIDLGPSLYYVVLEDLVGGFGKLPFLLTFSTVSMLT